MTRDAWRARESKGDGEAALNLMRGLSAVFSVLLVSYFVYALVAGVNPLLTMIALGMLLVFLMIFAYLVVNPDPLRSQYTERSLAIASELLEDVRDGLTADGAEAICGKLLSETHAMSVAVTNTECVLACKGELERDFPPGSPIHTPATRYAIEHGLVQSFVHVLYTRERTGEEREIPAGIVAPLRVSSTSIGALKFYFRHARDVDRTQYALASGYAELISTQLSIHELERQEELTARAEVRALQAQINPHFLFNTLNTIAAFTRTEPLRARELLREFAAFYRATLDNSGSLIPLSREIAQTERYLLFEKARFGEDRIVEHMDVDAAAEDTLVPSFVIQPLVENAVRHAMRDEGPLHIEVSVRSDGEDALDITVADDGVGMDPETAARLFDRSAEPPDLSQPQGGGAGVAMRNIHDRIARFYGPRSVARAESEPGQGTRILLHLDLRGSIFADADGTEK